MTKRYGEIGYPVGTILVVPDKVGIIQELRGTLVKTVQALSWSDKFQNEGYFVGVIPDNKAEPYYFFCDGTLEFRSFPVTLQNWCRTKVNLLLEIDPLVAFQLGREKSKGLDEESYECCYPNVPKGDSK